MSKNSTIYVVIIGILLICLLASVGILVTQMVNNPFGFKGWPIGQSTATVKTATPIKHLTSASPTTLSSTTPPPTMMPQTCGRNGVMTIQMIGRDEYHWNLPFGADSIRYVKVDFDKKQATIFAFQRDLFLKSEWLNKKYGIPESKLGSVFNTVIVREGNINSTQTNIDATNAIAEVLFENFAVAPDHYATFMAPFLKSIVDTLGGIPVNVSKNMNINGVSFIKGKTTMNGTQAELYFRYINTSEDEWARFDRQNSVVKGLAQKITEPSTITKVPQLISDYKKLVITDLNPEEITQLTCIFKEIPSENIIVTSLPPEMITVQPNGTMVIKNMEAAQKFVEEALK